MADPIRAEAADLLACLASQPGEGICMVTSNAPGQWRRSARMLAARTWRSACDGANNWRENYAEAEALLREVTRG